MTPRVAGRGHSFKGAGQYYFHDKGADTAERVAWTHTHNLPTNNPEKAMRMMAWTAMHADQIKEQAGGSKAGAKKEAGIVYTYSLSWHPEDDPEQKTVFESALETLELLGLNNHEAVFVAHNDTAHPHVHVIANLVNPETGKVADIYRDHQTLSNWAEAYEREHGIRCDQRIKNNEKRREGEYVRHKEERIERAEIIQQIYNQSDGGKAFQAGLEEAGYTLAKGDRRGFVLVDQAGEVHSLSRQLKEQRAKEIKARLSDINPATLPAAKTLEDERKYYDRDRYNAEQEQAVIDAAIEAEKNREDITEGDIRKLPPPSAPINLRQKFMDAGHEYFGAIDEYEAKEKAKKAAKGKQVKPEFNEQSTRTEPENYKSVADEVDRQNALKDGPWRRRLQQEDEVRDYYQISEQEKELAAAQAELDTLGAFGKLTGKRREQEERVKALRKGLDNARRRQAESMGRIEAQYKKELDQALGRDKEGPAPANDSNAMKFKKTDGGRGPANDTNRNPWLPEWVQKKSESKNRSEESGRSRGANDRGNDLDYDR